MTVTKKYPNNYFKDKKCKTCETTFLPVTPAELYCSKDCRGKNSYYRRNYGFDQKELEKMKVEQNNKCAICGSGGFIMGKHGTKKLVVDHDHVTGQVRSLLCHNCNRGLGLFQDNYSLLRNAAKYLQDHNTGKLVWSEYIEDRH